MFWRMAGYSQPSPLEAILDMDGFSLEDLLDEADIIQVSCTPRQTCAMQKVVWLPQSRPVRALMMQHADMHAPDDGGIPHLAAPAGCKTMSVVSDCLCSLWLWHSPDGLPCSHQECKSLNGRLVNFLKAPATLQQLLAYIVEDPKPGTTRAKQHYNQSDLLNLQGTAQTCLIFTSGKPAVRLRQRIRGVLSAQGVEFTRRESTVQARQGWHTLLFRQGKKGKLQEGRNVGGRSCHRPGEAQARGLQPREAQGAPCRRLRGCCAASPAQARTRRRD